MNDLKLHFMLTNYGSFNKNNHIVAGKLKHYIKNYKDCFLVRCYYFIAVLFLQLVCCSQQISAQDADYLWAKSIGGTGNELVNAMTLDASGNIYITGRFNALADFDPGTGIENRTPHLNAAGTFPTVDIFVAKYDSAGNYLWAISMGATGEDIGYDIAVDGSGNVYVTGSFQGTVDFNPGNGSATFTAENTDMFLAKYDANGNFLWVKTGGGTGSDYGYGVALDAAGNVYATGSYASATAEFNPGGTGDTLNRVASADAYLVKYDGSGNFLWAKSMGGTGQDVARTIAVDAIGNIYLSGYFSNPNADFDPGTNVANLIHTGGQDIFLAKYNSNGDYLWARSIGGSSTDNGYKLALDGSSNVYVTGFYGLGTAYVYATGGSILDTLTPVGQYDVFLAKYDPNGNYLWAHSVGGSDFDYGYGVAADAAGNAYITGRFIGSVDFNPGSGTAMLTSAGRDDVYIARYDAAGNYVWAKNVGGSSIDQGIGIAVDGSDNVYVTGIFIESADFDPGPDSAKLIGLGNNDIFILKLSQICQVLNELSQSECDSFVFNGVTYTVSGVYTDTFASGNCDSIVILDLTITGYASATPVFSGHYCDSVTFNGVTYTASGTYVQPYGNVTGCDSSITYELTIVGSPQAAVALSGNTLSASDAESYQWLNCDQDHAPEPGATGQTFKPSISGNYAVIITSGECSDTSDCVYVEVEPNGVRELTTGNKALLYPNPADGKVILKTEKALNNATIILLNLQGQVVLKQTGKQGNLFTLDITSLAGGLYFVEISEYGASAQLKLVKK